jgi:ferredoxin
MIRVDEALCTGCGACIDECPVGAITQVNGTVMIDSALCDGCGSSDEARDKLCIDICANGALIWVGERVAGMATEPSSLAIVKPPVQVISVEPRKTAPVTWRRMVLPPISAALAWVGREVVPRLATQALHALDSALDRRLSRWAEDEDVTRGAKSKRRGQGKQQRRRHRQSRPRK